MEFKKGLDFQNAEDNHVYLFLFDKSSNSYLAKHRWTHIDQTSTVLWFDKTAIFESHFEAIIWLRERKKLVDSAC